MTAEEFYNEKKYPEYDKFDKKVPKFDYYDMLDFAEAYHKHEVEDMDIVVELSDNEIKIITQKELEEWQKSAIEFDGFEGWIVKGKLLNK